MNKRLEDRPFLAGEYSIADMACYPWVVPHERQKQDLNDFPNLQRWFEAIKTRPATIAAYKLADAINVRPTIDDVVSRRIMFNQNASSIK